MSGILVVPSKMRETARSTRRWAKALQRRHTGLGSEHLAMMCGIANFELFRRLKLQGFKVFLVVNQEHCFVEWKSLYVLDVTATQFGYFPAVAIVKRSTAFDWDHWERGRGKKLHLLSDAQKWFRTWPPEQCPFRYEKRLDK